MKSRNEDVDKLVRDRLEWLAREIKDRAKEIEDSSVRISKLKTQQELAEAERERLQSFLGLR